MNKTLLLFLLLVRPRSILVVINFESDWNLNEREFQEEKIMLIKRIEDLPKEHSYEFKLFFYSPFYLYLSSKKSKKDIIDEIRNKISKVLPEGTKECRTFFIIKILNNFDSYDSRSIISSVGGGVFLKVTIPEFLRLGYLVEIVSVRGLKYIYDGVTINSSDKVIGKRTCSENIKQKKCEEGFVFSLPKNCYADYTPMCHCNTEGLRQYGITQEYPCPTYNVDGYCQPFCGEGLLPKNLKIITLKCDIKTKSWIKEAGECLCLNVINPEIENKLCENKSIGESCTYTCKKPNEFPKNEIVRCTINGWDNQMMCGKKCPPISIKNAVEIIPAKKEYSIEDKIQVTCETGFEKKGDVPTCQKTGEWTEFSCEKIVCRALEIENSIQTDNALKEYLFGETIDVTCASGFKKKETVTTCIEQGVWSNAPCEKISEPKSKSKTQYDIGDKSKVICQSGFEKKGEDAICQKTGEWTENDFSCENSQMSLKLKFYLFNGLLFIFI